ncbi:MAG: alpha/beta fold hydrolase [Candidatus Moraniibacteriota bacterium]
MQEKIYFKNKEGLKLCGVLSNPTGDKNRPIIILCHGFSTGKDSSTNIALEKTLGEKGVSTFRFDFFGHKESEGNFEEINVSKAVEDILCAIDFLKELGYQKIGLEGSSFGGFSAIIATSKSRDLFVLALKCPVVDYYETELKIRGEKGMENWREDGYVRYNNGDGSFSRVNYSFVEDFSNNNALEAGKRIEIPTLIIIGDNDEFITIDHVQKLSSVVQDCKLEILPDANHHFSKPDDFQKIIEDITEFILKHCN